MWRLIDYREDNHGNIIAVVCQCLSRNCKQSFLIRGDGDEKFCPHCGKELGRQFTKKNHRYEIPNPTRHYPWLEFYVLKDVGRKELLAKDGFYTVPKLESSINVRLYPEEFIMGKRPKIDGMRYFHFQFRKILNSLRKDFSNDCIKIIIKRWDKSEKIMYGGQFS